MLRKKPAGALLSSTAHQVEREYAMLAALHAHNISGRGAPVPIPIPYALCTDSAVVGTPFYIMQFLEGRIFSDARLPGLPDAERRAWCVVY